MCCCIHNKNNNKSNQYLHHEGKYHEQEHNKGHQHEEPGHPRISRIANNIENPCPDCDNDDFT